MKTFLTILILVAMLAVLGVLFVGLFGVARSGGGNPARSNKLMRWRVVLQAVALALLGLLMLIQRH
ncbi:twin transmembrane helix small protein [Plastoroseomonas hellenica]|uniref:Twin transmembrane helix small protein n=1 Tax=Plastoroseomonas hellenica TaxID=2687306 RepID=A0ABS5EZ34_9PROT|nr:twin transmembrane helix small protein [Plastoroseomonas hellenica]MBR0645424.1 twin transmembrane helix small protein [Plastoroseomonas hellenica]MBR0665554.1 twin transmembrane helix small protein [Plastoroseomonas hellenica]